MAAARKKKTKKAKRRRKAPAKATRCRALMVVDSSVIRRKHMADCRRARTTFRKAEQELDVYESRDKPAFRRWYHAVAGPEIADAKSLSRQMREVHEKMRRVERFAGMTGCGLGQAARLYEDAPAVFEQRERQHLDAFRRQEEERQRRREARRDAMGRSMRKDFARFLDSREDWVRASLARAASPEELLFDLILMFHNATGYSPPDVAEALANPEGAEILARHGFTPETSEAIDDGYADPDFGADDDAFEDFADAPRPSALSDREEDRLKALRRELAFALHPDHAGAETDPARLELWYRVQEAVEARDLDRLEVLHAHWQMLAGGLSPRVSLSRVIGLTAMYRRSRAALRRRIRSLRCRQDWGFAKLSETDRERMRRRLVNEVRAYIERLRHDLAEAEAYYQERFLSRRGRRPPPAPPTEGQPSDPRQGEFAF